MVDLFALKEYPPGHEYYPVLVEHMVNQPALFRPSFNVPKTTLKQVLLMLRSHPLLGMVQK